MIRAIERTAVYWGANGLVSPLKVSWADPTGVEVDLRHLLTLWLQNATMHVSIIPEPVVIACVAAAGMRLQIMNYTDLRFGDHLPSVGVLQLLLNRAGATLHPDGRFGPKTQAAVKQFQWACNLSPDGIVGIQTWSRLTRGVSLPIVDCIDVMDSFEKEQLYKQAEREAREGKASSAKTLEQADEWVDTVNNEVAAVRSVGGNPHLLGGMCNGVAQAVSTISAAAREVFLMRFHGHGRTGSVGVAAGMKGGWTERHKIFTNATRGKGGHKIWDDRTVAMLRPLRSAFGPYGSVELMGCETARPPDGPHLLAAVAKQLGVPVSAGINDQLGGGWKAFRFEGPVRTAFFPPGMTLEKWCGALPKFPTSLASPAPVRHSGVGAYTDLLPHRR